jgi:exodeoxyribonuclease VII large subunit
MLLHQHHRLSAAARARWTAARSRVDSLANSRVLRRPLERVQQAERYLDDLAARARRAVAGRLETARGQVDAKALQLDSLSPLAVLGRGYSLSLRLDDGRLVRSVRQVTPGDKLLTRVTDGEIVSQIEQARPARVITSAEKSSP